ncbi:MAG: AbrB/MazE/SpoVT family DNA-binding domain-containing protein [Desulfotomaculales bacterium]
MMPGEISKTTVSPRYQTVIPAAIREKYNIREGSRLAWIPGEGKIEVVPLPAETHREFRGSGRGKKLLQTLLAYRAEEREK